MSTPRDVVALLTALEHPATGDFIDRNRHQHLTSHSKPKPRHTRATTQPPDACTLALRLSNPPRDGSPDFVVGSIDTADVQIGDRSHMISGRHLLIGFNPRRQVVIMDISRFGSRISYNPRSVGFETLASVTNPSIWVVPAGRRVFIEIRGYAFTVSVPDHSSYLNEYLASVDQFIFERRSQAIPEFGNFRLASQDPTRAPTPSKVNEQVRYGYVLDESGILGRGGYGVVRKVYKTDTWEIFAAKTMDKLHVELEVRFLQRLRHPHIIRYEEWYEQKGQPSMLIMELCQCGDLVELQEIRKMEGKSGLDTRDIIMVAEQASGALAYLHSEKVVHRDVKPANILVRCADPLNIAVADFGLAKADQPKMVSRKGTPFYAAPEMLYGRSKYGSSVDIWSLGLVMLEYLWGINHQYSESSWGHSSIDNHWQSLQLTSIVTARDDMLDNGPGPFQKLLGRMLEQEPGNRPTARECHETTYRIREQMFSTTRQHAAARRQQVAPASRPLSGPSSQNIPPSYQRSNPKSHEAARQGMQAGAPNSSGSANFSKKLGFCPSSGDRQHQHNAHGEAQDSVAKKRVNSVEASAAGPQAHRRHINL